MTASLPRRDFRRHTIFVQGLIEGILLFATLCLLAWLLYTSYVGGFYVNATKAIRSSTGVRTIMGSDALLPADFVDDTLEKRQLLVHRLLILQELVDAETTRDELEKKDHPGHMAYSALAGVQGDTRAWPNRLWDSHTLELVVHLSQALGVPERGQLSREEVRGLTADVLASVLARQQGSAEAWISEVHLTGSNAGITEKQEEPLKVLANRMGTNAPWSSGFVVFPEPGMDGDKVIQTLFQQFKVVDAYSPFEHGNAKTPDEMEQIRVATLLMQKLLATIEDDSQVKQARTWLSVLQGPEQLCLIFIALLLITLILVRFVLASYESEHFDSWIEGTPPKAPPVELPNVLLPTSVVAYLVVAAILGITWFASTAVLSGVFALLVVSALCVEVRLIFLLNRGFVWHVSDCINNGASETDVRDFVKDQGHAARQSRWLLQFLKIALGGIGFFGTCRGLMLALPLVPDIVAQARTPHELSAAFREVTTTLSLSMTTTLVALALTLAIDPFERKQAAQESVFFNRMLTALPRLFGTGRPTTPLPRHAATPANITGDGEQVRV